MYQGPFLAKFKPAGNKVSKKGNQLKCFKDIMRPGIHSKIQVKKQKRCSAKVITKPSKRKFKILKYIEENSNETRSLPKQIDI